MSDNKRWFKVWTSLLVNIVNEDITPEEIGRFTILGCLVAQQGKNGTVTLSKNALKTFLKTSKLDNSFMQKFNISMITNDDNKTITEGDNSNITVTIKNWSKFQLDSTGYERLKKHRKKTT